MMMSRVTRKHRLSRARRMSTSGESIIQVLCCVHSCTLIVVCAFKIVKTCLMEPKKPSVFAGCLTVFRRWQSQPSECFCVGVKRDRSLERQDFPTVGSIPEAALLAQVRPGNSNCVSAIPYSELLRLIQRTPLMEPRWSRVIADRRTDSNGEPTA